MENGGLNLSTAGMSSLGSSGMVSAEALGKAGEVTGKLGDLIQGDKGQFTKELGSMIEGLQDGSLSKDQFIDKLMDLFDRYGVFGSAASQMREQDQPAESAGAPAGGGGGGESAPAGGGSEPSGGGGEGAPAGIDGDTWSLIEQLLRELGLSDEDINQIKNEIEEKVGAEGEQTQAATDGDSAAAATSMPSPEALPA